MIKESYEASRNTLKSGISIRRGSESLQSAGLKLKLSSVCCSLLG